jgi:cell division protein FtsB
MEKRFHFKVVVHPGRTVTKLVLLGVIALSTVSLISLYRHIHHKESANQALREQAIQLELENQKLTQYSENKHTDEGIRQVAQNEQGLVDPDTVIYDFG